MYKSHLELTHSIKTTRTTEVLPFLDAEGFATCPDCGSRVNCGTIGLANLALNG